MADLADRMRVLTKHYDLPNEASEALLGGAAEIEVLRTTLARLTADLAAVTSERDMWRSECESISAELDLPPGIRPAEGEFRRMLDHRRALLAQVTTLTAERDEARGKHALAAGEALALMRERDASDTTRREWEVRAATSYADGRKAGLREADKAAQSQVWGGDDPPASMDEYRRGQRRGAIDCVAMIRRAIAALAPPAAETPPAGVGHALSLGVCCAACYRDGKHSAPFRPMILCPKCGNKRCPRAGSHANACTNSNEPGQVATPAADPRDEGEVSGG